MRAEMRQPRWDSPWNRPLALLELALQPVMLPAAVLWFGLSELPSGQLHQVRVLLKVLLTGKRGPSAGIVW